MFKKNSYVSFSSTELPSDISKEATEKNPVTILVGVHKYGNGYNPINNKLFLSLNLNAIQFLGTTPLKTALEKYPNIYTEFDEQSIKGSIAHELSHWLNDTFHNKTIEKQLNKYQKLRGTKKEISNIEWSFLTFHEIDAFIHSVSSLKNQSTNWDEITFLDLLNMKPSLKHIIITLVKKATKTEYNKWIKRFFKRLVRENLLGKNMRPFSYDVAKTIS